jgi:hypothetical protein
MFGDGRLNRKRRFLRSKIGLTIIPLVLFAAVGIAITLVFPHFDASMPAQLLVP